MNPSRLTALAALACEPAGATVRYEAGARGFCWNFYQRGHLVKSIRNPHAVLYAAEKIVVDIGK